MPRKKKEEVKEVVPKMIPIEIRSCYGSGMTKVNNMIQDGIRVDLRRKE